MPPKQHTCPTSPTLWQSIQTPFISFHNILSQYPFMTFMTNIKLWYTLTVSPMGPWRDPWWEANSVEKLVVTATPSACPRAPSPTSGQMTSWAPEVLNAPRAPGCCPTVIPSPGKFEVERSEKLSWCTGRIWRRRERERDIYTYTYDDRLSTCLFLVWLINRNSMRAASCLLFNTVTYLNSLKPCNLSFMFETPAKTAGNC